MHSLKLLLPVAEALGWAVLLLKLQGAEEGTSSLTFPPREYLSTRSSLSTNTSFGQTRSTSVYNRHYKWLLTPRNWALTLCFTTETVKSLCGAMDETGSASSVFSACCHVTAVAQLLK